MAKIKRFFIVDVMAMAYRTFFALGSSQLSRKDGLPTGAIYGSAMFLNKLLQEEQPDYLAFVSDAPGPTFRHEIYKDYKAHRDEAPADLKAQIPHIFDLITRFGFDAIQEKGYEADDLIGTFASKFASEKVHIYIVSGDKDFYQLVSDRVFLYAPKRNDRIEIVDIEGVYKKFSCTPEQVIDCLALIGDSSDNVPGVKGIGEKGAAQLIEAYGSLEGIYENLEKITAKRQRNGLENYRGDAFLSKELVTIDRKVPIPFKLKDFACDAMTVAHRPEILNFYESMEFKGLARKITKAVAPEEGTGKEVDDRNKSLPRASRSAKVVTVTDDQMADFLSNLQEGSPISVWVEFDGDTMPSRRLRKIWISHLKQNLCYEVPQDSDERLISMTYISTLFGDRNHIKVGYDLKRVAQALYNEDLSFELPIVDIQVVAYLIDPNENRQSWEHLLDRYLGVLPESGQESSQLLRLYNEMMSHLRRMNLESVLDEIEMPLLPVLAKMEFRGVAIDASYLMDYSRDLNKKVRSLEKRIYKEAGQEFNINSTKQLAEIMFDDLAIHEELGVKKIKKTKTGYSTDESVLTSLSAHPLPKLVLEYRMLTKLKSTWIDSLPQHIDSQSDRVHASFHQTVAATGRLSSDKPNLQNIPMRTDEGRLIRKAFVASKGYLLLSADYSQVEIRLLAGMANESHLIEAFKNGEDIHTATAAKIFGIAPEDVDVNIRSRAKAVNFGILYGMGPQRLAQETGVSLTEAKDFIQKYFAAYPGIKSFTDGLIQSAKTHGYTTTITGRRRPVPGLADGNRAVAARAENIAVNSPIQGSAADIIKIAMIRIHADLERERLKAYLIMQVHDELIVECHQDDADKVAAIIKVGMEEAVKFPVPLIVEQGQGRTWYDAH
ncbi:DNA polymerase I [Pseudobacteriovorax antillogorgiicola]|uniref:DNA polymerase I n=1 Tax=Pseudobacteriovorax antillogorgiicola TaxID=1513793 RepID=A0A1Y6CRT1_9BACT|nr:DNA polymerase I [Pseudobacteriovorax antillogorgiicola]TCS46390.1 DNA polymerase I [Pseudobacteriovorax antillogorgiicola]SMF68699.1 DNA polymerase I [Pseudobacteriovorax antillogorgiicola]